MREHLSENKPARGFTVVRMYARAFLHAFIRFNRKNGAVMSSHVAMSMMMALFPFILFVVSLAGVIYQDVPEDVLIELFFGYWPDDVAAPIVKEVHAVLESSSSRLMTVGGVLAIYFASNGVDAVRIALSRAYHDTDPRPYWETRAMAIGCVIAGGGALLLAVVLEIWNPLYANMVQNVVPGDLPSWFTGVGPSWLAILSLPMLGVLVCHLILPGRRHSFRQVLPGVIMTLLLWAISGWAFSIYIARFATYSATYAGLAGAMSALIFLYLMSAILILGAEFNGALLGVTDADDDEEMSHA